MKHKVGMKFLRLHSPYTEIALSIKAMAILLPIIAIYLQDLAMVANEAIRSELMSHILAIPFLLAYLVYTRHVLGSIFVLWLPGYTLIKALFPAKELDNIERTALSIGMSLALVPITGLLLNYTPWGIRATPVTLSLLALTITFATAAVTREFHLTRMHENSL